MHSIAEDFPKNLCFILILGACDYRTLTACNHLNTTNYNIRCISVPQTHSQRGLKICVWLWQGVDTLMPGHLQHTAANIDADLQHTAVKSHVRCDPTLHATNIYFNCFIFQQTNLTINPYTSLWWPETTLCPSILFLSLSLSDFSWHSWHSSEVSIRT